MALRGISASATRTPRPRTVRHLAVRGRRSREEAAGLKQATMGTVVVYLPDGNAQRDHTTASQRWIASRLASIKGFEFAGEYNTVARYPRPVYFVPGEVLAAGAARALGIHGEQDLFGGVVERH